MNQCKKPPLGAPLEEKINHASCVLNSIIYHLQELATAYDRVGNKYAAKDVRGTHAKMVKMREILHSPLSPLPATFKTTTRNETAHRDN